MAEASVLKLKVDSQEYDAKIKRASEGLRAMEQACRKVGGTFEVVEKEELAFVRSLGNMDTVSRNTRGQLRELTQALTDMTAMYRGLSDAEKKSDFGRALNQSIQQLTERAGEAKDAMMDVSASITNAASDTRGFDQATAAMSTMTSAFQVGQGAAKMLGLEIGDNVEVIAKLQSAMAVVNGLQTIQNALQKQSALMQGLNALKTTAASLAQAAYAAACGEAAVAQEALNIAMKSNPLGLVLTLLAAGGVALYSYMNSTEDAEDATNDFTKAEKNNKKAIDEKKQAMEKAIGQYSDTMAKIRSLITLAQNENATMVERKRACGELNKIIPNYNANIDNTTGAFKAQAGALDDLTSKLQTYYRMLAAEDYLKSLYKKEIETTVEVETLQAKSDAATGKYKSTKAKNDADEAKTVGYVESATPFFADPKDAGVTVMGAHKSIDRSGEEQARKDMESATQALEASTQELTEVRSTIKTAEGVYKTAVAQNGGYKPTTIEPVKTSTPTVRGGGHSGGGRSGGGRSGGGNTGGGNTGGGNDEYVPLKGSLDYLESQLNGWKTKYRSATDEAARSLADAQIQIIEKEIAYIKGEGFRSRMGEIRSDVLAMPYDTNIGIGGKDYSKPGKLTDMTLDTSFGQQLLKRYWDPDAGQPEKAKGKYEETGAVGFAQDIHSGLSGISSSLQAFGLSQDNGFSKLIDKMGAVITIITSIQTIVSAIEAIDTISTLIPFARGGVVHAAGGYRVPGNYMSGDLVPAMVNSGELVLNKAQQGNLASQLQGGGFGMNLTATIKGEDIRLALNNNSRRRGKGEYVTTKFG